jgi:hypothetical protein
MQTTTWHRVPPISRFATLIRWIVTPLGTHLLQLAILTPIVLWLAWQLKAPVPLPATAPPTAFSAERAMKYVEQIAQQTHPLGSEDNARVRRYLIDELTALGLAPEVQTATVTRNMRGEDLSGTVHNIVARLYGTNATRAVLLAAHYDSTSMGSGAGDDAAGVAALLETLRALRAGSPLRNDVIFLFTDGEERGLLGAKAFVDSHRWAGDISVALNFEARGNAGPVIMFETSENNRRLIRQFAQAAPDPRAYSFVSDLYKRMPNDTDLTEFKRGGMAGMNFAMAEGWATYHMPQDTTAALDRGSLQHHGASALALARQFGNLNLDNKGPGNEVYFSVAGWLIHYPQAWAVPLAALAALAFGGGMTLGFWRKRITLPRIGLAILAYLLSVVIAAVLGFMAVRLLIGFLHENDMAPRYDSRLYAVGFAALALASTVLLYRWLRTRVGVSNLMVGAGACWVLLALATGLALPGASYLFTWPLVCCLLVLEPAMASTQPTGAVMRWAALVPAVVVLALFIPAIWVLFTLLPITLYPAGVAVAAVTSALVVSHSV